MSPTKSGRVPHPLPPVVLTVATVAAAALGWLPAWPGLVHAVALPPLGLAHDLAAWFVFATDWPTFLLGVAASILARSALLAVMAGGPGRESFLFALRFYLAATPLALLAAAAFYGAGALLFYALFWFGMIFALVLIVAFGALPWQGTRRLRSAFSLSAGAGFRAGTVGAYLVGLTGVGVVADLAEGAWTVAMVPVSAAVTWLAARTMTGLSPRPGLRRAVALAGAGGLVALAVPVVTGPGGPPTAPAPETSREGSIMLMSGVDSLSGSGAILEIDPHFMGWTCERTFYYSYAGPGEGQPRRLAECPIRHGAPYTEVDTLRPAAELVDFLEDQTGEMIDPGVLAAHSQGVWLTWAAAADGRLPNVETLVLVGPFPLNPISYPPAGAEAPGRVGHLVLQVISRLPRPGGSTIFVPDSPLGRDWLAHPSAISDTLARPLPGGVRALSVPSVYDLPLMPSGRGIHEATAACPVPVVHPNLPYSSEFQRVVVAFVEGDALPACPPWRIWVGRLFRHFTAPPGP